MHRILETSTKTKKEETMTNSMKRNTKIVSVIAVAGMMSLGAAPSWAQTSSRSDRQAQQQSSGLLSAEAIKDTKVMDSQNREIGELNNIFIDPKSGKISRADIAFSGDVIGDGKTYSVAWDQLTVKQQGDKITMILDQSVVDRVAQAGRKGDKDRAQVRSESGRQTESSSKLAAPESKQSAMSEQSAASEKDRQAISGPQMSSANIRKVQQKLNKEGFHAGAVDGQWSSQTQSAIRNFQQSKGLKVTGQLDERTLDELGVDADELREKRSETNSGKSSEISQ